VKAGLDATEIARLFAGDDFIAEVEQDVQEAHQLGIDTVPTFLFERKQAIIGSEPVQVFLDTLNQAYESWKKANTTLDNMKVKKGKSCNADGTCEI
jgi:protein disulfide-isomerase